MSKPAQESLSTFVSDVLGALDVAEQVFQCSKMP